MSDINHNRMIPLHIADQAVAACEKEIATLKAEVERLTSNTDKLCKHGDLEIERLKADLTNCKSEADRLKAEVERLKAEKDQAECDYDNCQKRKVSIDNHRFYLFNENKNLKAEVERIRASSFVTAVPVEQYERVIKAGDDVFCIACNAPSSEGRQKVLKAWQAAKEGKQS